MIWLSEVFFVFVAFVNLWVKCFSRIWIFSTSICSTPVSATFSLYIPLRIPNACVLDLFIVSHLSLTPLFCPLTSPSFNLGTFFWFIFYFIHFFFSCFYNLLLNPCIEFLLSVTALFISAIFDSFSLLLKFSILSFNFWNTIISFIPFAELIYYYLIQWILKWGKKSI